MSYKYEQWPLPTHKSKIHSQTTQKKMVPKSVGMLKRNIHWIFNEINKLSADAPHTVEEEDEAVPVALRACVGKFYSFLLFSFFIY